MSLTGALNSAVSALSAQSLAIAMSSDNLANSGTYGYKTTEASFWNLVTGGSTANSYSSGGVLARSLTNVSEQGLLVQSGVSTNVAINGNGFFPVRDGLNGGLYYTRNGQFAPDANGYLVNGGYYLQGWATDADGNVVGSALETIDIDKIASTASPTTECSVKANLPAEAAVSDAFTTSMPVYDSLGTAHTIEVTWTKTAANEWEMDFADPVLASDTSVTSGTAGGGPITITFNDDGTFASSNPDPAELTVTGWTTGAADSTIALALGEAGKATGLSQYSSDMETPDIDLDSITPNGVAYGKLSSISIDASGTVIGSYSNGEAIALYKIPVATFANPNGLSARDGGAFAETRDSGASVLHEAGQGGAGDVAGNSLEASTTDTSKEFTNIMTAQQAYSAAAQILTTVDEMYNTLLQSMR